MPHPASHATQCPAPRRPAGAVGGRGAVILPAGGRFSATTFWRDAVDFGATFYTAVPTMHQARHAQPAGLAPRCPARRAALCQRDAAQTCAAGSVGVKVSMHCRVCAPQLHTRRLKACSAWATHADPAVARRQGLPGGRAAAAALHPLLLVIAGARHAAQAGGRLQGAGAGGALRPASLMPAWPAAPSMPACRSAARLWLTRVARVSSLHARHGLSAALAAERGCESRCPHVCASQLHMPAQTSVVGRLMEEGLCGRAGSVCPL